MRGVFLYAKYAGRAMVRQGSRSMVFTVTTEAQVGCAGLDAYTATKGGVVAFTRSLAVSSAHHGIRVNVISPSFVNTEPQAIFMNNAQTRAESERRRLLPVPGPEDVTPLALFLASEQVRCIRASAYQVGAGFTVFKSQDLMLWKS